MSVMIKSIRNALLLGAAFSPGAVHAQSGAGDQAASIEEHSAMDGEILVTARRRAERAIDVPAAVTALDEQAITKFGANDLNTLGAQVPQVMFTKNPSGNGANIAIRGVGTNTSADDGVEQAVSVTVDGFSTARGRVLQTGLFDIGSVQVLKGPQALYFGKNSPGGVIVIDSKGPTESFEGYVRAGYEFQAHEYYGEAAVGGPISPTLGFRVAVRGSDMRQGYVHNMAQPISAANNPIAWDKANGYAIPGRAFEWGPQSKNIAGRVTLKWEPSSDFDATLKMFYSHYKDQGDGSQNTPASCPVGSTHPIIRDLSKLLLSGPPANLAVDPVAVCARKRVNYIGELPDALRDALPFNGRDTAFTDNKNYLGTLTMAYRADGATITSVTGYYKYDNVGNSFFDSTNLSIAGGGANSHYEAISQELRADVELSDMFSLSGGAYFGHDSRTYRTWSDIIRYVSVPTATAPANSVTSSTIQRTTGTSISAYATATVKLAEQFELSGGARFTREKKDATLFSDYVSAPGAAFNLALPVGKVLTPRLSNSNVSPQVTLSWKPNRDINVYLGYRTGFKAGAITNPGLLPASQTSTNAVLNPEKIKGFEGGVKFQSADRMLSGELSAYSYNFKDLQLSAFSSVTNTVMTTNAGKARLSGVEGTLRFRPSEPFELHGSFGYNDSHYTKFTNAACWAGQTAAQGCVASQQDLTGKPLPRSPKWSGAAGVSYGADVSSNLHLGVNLDGRFSSKYIFVATNNPYAAQKGYAALDGAIRLSDQDRKWELALIGRNLTNKFYYVVGSETPLAVAPGSIMGVPGTPRTVTVQVTYNF